MSEIKPSDLTLTSNYVAIEPGNYPARTDLTKYKGTNLTEAEALDFKLNVPLGIGSSDSVVYVYQQGTIEVIGQVYCWNKLVKPGIYSRYEKLRYLTEEVILDRDNDDVYKHHAAYNKTIRVPNSFVNKRTNGNNDGWQIRYNYVSFQDQIRRTDGTKSYPIPVFNGKLTIYPDGTFKTENVVIKSNDTKIVDPYGYIADSDNYGSIKTYFDDVTKDDVNPLNVYKLISENEDGSITYGAVEANTRLTASTFPKMPLGIIPVNDGKVTVNSNGTLDISGTVITSTGYKINADHFRYIDLVTNRNGVLKFNEEMLDKSGVYNPSFTNIGVNGLEYNRVISVANGKKDVYRYHTANDTFNAVVTNQGFSTTFTPMKGWDTFVKDNGNILFDNIYNTIFAINNNNQRLNIDKDRYPWSVKGIFNINDRFIYPTLRYSPEGELDSYTTLDHTVFWNPDNLVSYQFINQRVNVIDRASETLRYQTFPTLNKTKIEIPKGYNFIPYDTTTSNRNKSGSIRIVNESGTYYIVVTGKVIWKRKEEYFTLNEGKVKLDYTWPAIVEDEQGHYKSLYTVNGYFNSGVTFRDKRDPNSVYTLDGIRTKTDGLFSLIKRNVTSYLSDYEKMIIDNTGTHFKDYTIDNEFKITERRYFYLDTEFTNKHTDIVLKYYSYRFHDYLPWFFEATRAMFENPNQTHINYIHRFLYQDRGNNELNTYRDAIFNLRTNDRNENSWYILKAPRGIYSKDKIDGLQLIKTSDSLYRGNSIPGYTTMSGFRYSNEYDTPFFRRNDVGMEFYPDFNFNHTDGKHTLTDGPVRVTLTNRARDKITVFYRTSEDLANYPKHVVVEYTGEDVITLDVNLKAKYGWVDVWADDPYEEEHDRTIKRLKLRRDKQTQPVAIREPIKEDISARTRFIIGTGEPKASLVIYKQEDPNTPIFNTNLNENGVWRFSGISSLELNKVYVVKQTDEFGGVTYDTFTVYPYRFKNGDKITIEELMGENIHEYVVPVNISRTNQNDLNIESSIEFSDDGIYQYYTIKGIVANDKGKIYTEGTYRLGTAPILSYSSSVIVNSKGMLAAIKKTQQVMERSTRKYIFDTNNPYTATIADKVDNLRILNSASGKVSEYWWIAPEWVEQLETHLNSMTQVEFNRRYPNISGIDKNRIIEHFKKATGSVYVDGAYVSRYKNKLTVELNGNIPYEIITSQGSVYLYQNALSKTDTVVRTNYKPDGYTPIEFLSLLSKQMPWFATATKSVPLSIVSERDSTLNYFSNDLKYPSKQTTQYNSPRLLLTNDNSFKVNNKKVLFSKSEGTDGTTAFNKSSSFYNVYNWDRIYEYNEYTESDKNIVGYAVDYSYTLTKNYPDTKEMDRIVLDNWVAKGANPRMFSFDDHTLGKVKFHENGRDVTIEGRVRVNGKYTRNKTQSLFPKNRVEFISFCPNAYLKHPDFPESTITLRDDDSIEITGNVLYRNVDENCQFVDAPTSDKLEHRLESVEIFSRYGTDWAIEYENLTEAQKGNDVYGVGNILKITIDDIDPEYREYVYLDIRKHYSTYILKETTAAFDNPNGNLDVQHEYFHLGHSSVPKLESIKPNGKYKIMYTVTSPHDPGHYTRDKILVTEEKQRNIVTKDIGTFNNEEFTPADHLFVFSVRVRVPGKEDYNFAESLSLLVTYTPEIVSQTNLSKVPSNLLLQGE